MSTQSANRCKVPPHAFWHAIENLGIHPESVLRLARLPASLSTDGTAHITTAQAFAIWRAVEQLANDPGFGIRLVELTDITGHKPAFFVAFLAADYRDALARVMRYKRLCTPERLHYQETNGQFLVTRAWPGCTEPEPHISIDANFAYLLELGRKGTGRHLTPLRVDFARPAPAQDFHQRYFGCEIRYNAPQDTLVLAPADLDLAFPQQNHELSQMISHSLTVALNESETADTIAGRVKAILKRTMASGRPEVAAIAQELGMSERTLQRRMTGEGKTFRLILAEARKELVRHLLADESLLIDEVAYLLGFQDTPSFYRAFKEWEGITPSHWRLRVGVAGMGGV